MKVNIILLESYNGLVPGLIKCRAGYGNFLIKTGKAKYATPKESQIFYLNKHTHIENHKKTNDIEDRALKILEGKDFVFIEQSNAGSLYGSITPSQLICEVNDYLTKNVDSWHGDRSAIRVKSQTIKKTGVHEIYVYTATVSTAVKIYIAVDSSINKCNTILKEFKKTVVIEAK